MGRLAPSGVAPTFDELIDLTSELLRTDPELRRLSRRIVRLQTLLQRELTPKGNRIFLSLEEVVNERWLELMARVWSLVRAERNRPRRRRNALAR